jgi:hypothetical protein
VENGAVFYELLFGDISDTNASENTIEPSDAGRYDAKQDHLPNVLSFSCQPHHPSGT